MRTTLSASLVLWVLSLVSAAAADKGPLVELGDFEIKMKHRLFGSPGINGGFQFRSKELPSQDVAGYQVDNKLNTDWLLRL